jgi:hypothetical protein
VGVDGFTVATSSSLGVRVEYPAQWSTVSVPDTNIAVRSADQNAAFEVAVNRTSAATLAQSDLESYASSLIAQVASATAPSYQALQVGGVEYVRALAPTAVITEASGAYVQAQVSVCVASYRHRAYSLRAVALTYLSTPEENWSPPALYPYFSPFTTLARSSQSTADLLQQQSELAAQTAWSLYVDPQVPDAG